MGSQAPVSVPGGALSPNSLKRPHTIGLQVFLLFFFYLNREPHLALSFSKVSEPPPLQRRGRPVGDPEGFILDDLERNSSRSPPSCPHLQSPEQSVRPCCRGSLGSITCFQLLGRKESGPLFFPTPPPSCTSTSIVSQCCRATVPFTVASDTPFHLPCRAVSLRMIAVSIVYTP